MTNTTAPNRETEVAVDPKDFRTALGAFTTGVTIITTRRPDGDRVGLTVSSFNSVSLDPPLVLWSLSVFALSMPAFQESNYFAVHVLSAGQTELSNRFAKAGEDKFAGLELEEGLGRVPLIADCAARFQCRSEYRYYGGDHVILVGRVEEYDHAPDVEPLLFSRGAYASQPQPLSI